MAGTRKRGQRELVIEALQKARKPLTSAEIAESTGVNQNTVRGAIVALRKDGKVKTESYGKYVLTGR